MHELLDALGTELRAFANEAAEAYVRENPRAFALYSIAMSDEKLRAIVADWDVQDWDSLRDEVKGYAVARLREMAEAGRVSAVTAGSSPPEWRAAARASDHPLLQLMADEEFGGAAAEEVDAALALAATLPGWNAERPAIVRCSI